MGRNRTWGIGAFQIQETRVVNASHRQRAAARRDLVQRFAWFLDNAGLEVAQQFLRSTSATFDELAKTPRIGPVKVHCGRFAGVRVWRINGFESLLILYRALDDGIAVERVIHAKQDFGRFLK